MKYASSGSTWATWSYRVGSDGFAARHACSGPPIGGSLAAMTLVRHEQSLFDLQVPFNLVFMTVSRFDGNRALRNTDSRRVQNDDEEEP